LTCTEVGGLKSSQSKTCERLVMPSDAQGSATVQFCLAIAANECTVAIYCGMHFCQSKWNCAHQIVAARCCAQPNGVHVCAVPRPAAGAFGALHMQFMHELGCNTAADCSCCSYRCTLRAVEAPGQSRPSNKEASKPLVLLTVVFARRICSQNSPSEG
jgi:hypothetical protein